MKKILAALLAAMMMLTLAACGGGNTAKTVDVQKLADDLKREANLYQPEDVARLDGALLRQTGTVVVLCVSDDTAAATAIVEGYLK